MTCHAQGLCHRYAARTVAGFLLSVCIQAGTPATEISVTDDTGAYVTLRAPAARVISLAPHLTELMFTLGAGAQIIATVQSADFPEAALGMTKVGDSASIDLERILSLNPDLILAWQSGNGTAVVERLRGLRVPVFVSEPDSLARIESSLRALGTLTARNREAEDSAAAFARRLASLPRRSAGGRNVAVFYQIWGRPIFTVSGRHLISEIIGLCGGRNVFADLPGLAGQVDVESVLAADPDVIVASGHDDSRPAWLDDWRRWPQMKAVQAGRLHHIPPALLQRHTVRVLDGAEMMCRFIAGG